MNTLDLLEGGGDESPRWGHSPRMRSGGLGVKAFSQILSDESWSNSLKHISTGEHSLHISWRSTHLLHLYFLFSWWRHRIKIFSALLALYAGNSPVTGEFPPQRPLTRSFDVFFDLRLNGWVNNQDAGDLRRHRAKCNVTVMCRIVIQWSGQPSDLATFNVSLLSHFELVKRFKLRGSVHYGRNGLKFGALLYLDYHCLKLTIFCTQQQFKFVLSDHLWISFELERKQIKYTFFMRMSDLQATPITNITHSACYTAEMGVSAKGLTRITLDKNHTAYMHIFAGDRLCVCQKLPEENYATTVINACSHRQCWKSKWCNHRQRHIVLLPLLHHMGIK